MLRLLFIYCLFYLLPIVSSDNCKGDMVDGQPQGFWQCFYANGNVQEEGNYEQGQKTGLWKFYHENGKVALEGAYRNGSESGTWKMYDDTGNQLDTIDYGS
jgi:antitoxin component YwqK of YwqJK toxin-antitoxin module